MPRRLVRWLIHLALLSALAAIFSPAAQAAHKSPPCVAIPEAISEAAAQPNKDLCVSAHVYDVVELSNGTRFLDVCPAGQPDEDCHFLILSLREDRSDVGELNKYRGQEVEIRGLIRPLHGRMGIVLSHARQFSGGPEKFRPNPKLLHGFNGQSDRMPVKDPNLSGSGRHRSFMNNEDKESLPSGRK
jgi:hypothetical protein